jgi:acid phosphatase
MRRYDELIWKGLAGLAAAAALALGEPAQALVPGYDHVVVVIFENHSYAQIIGNPQAPKLQRACCQ